MRQWLLIKIFLTASDGHLSVIGRYVFFILFVIVSFRVLTFPIQDHKRKIKEGLYEQNGLELSDIWNDLDKERYGYEDAIGGLRNEQYLLHECITIVEQALELVKPIEPYNRYVRDLLQNQGNSPKPSVEGMDVHVYYMQTLLLDCKVDVDELLAMAASKAAKSARQVAQITLQLEQLKQELQDRDGLIDKEVEEFKQAYNSIKISDPIQRFFERFKK